MRKECYDAKLFYFKIIFKRTKEDIVEDLRPESSWQLKEDYISAFVQTTTLTKRFLNSYKEYLNQISDIHAYLNEIPQDSEVDHRAKFVDVQVLTCLNRCLLLARCMAEAVHNQFVV